MATAHPLQIDKNPVPDGQTGTIAVTFDLASATLDVGPLSVILKDPTGHVAAELDGIMLKGHQAETAPQVVIGDVAGSWSISTSGGGTLTSLGNNSFSLGR